MTTEIALPPQVQAQSTDIVTRATSLVVSNPAEYQSAGELLRGIKTVRQNIDATFDSHIEAAHKAHKALLATKKGFEAPLATAEMTIKGKMGTWTREQEQKRREEEARLREIAQKEEEERRLREAAELEKAGETEAAEALVSAPVIAPTVVVAKQVPKTEGISTRTAWKFRIVNEALIPRQYLAPNEKAIGAIVRSLGQAARIPGIEVYSEDVVSVKGF